MSFVEVLIALLLLIVLALAVLADIVVLDGLLAQINKQTPRWEANLSEPSTLPT